MDNVVFEFYFVDATALDHNHGAVITLIVFPSAHEARAISPDHFSIAVSLPISEVSFILSSFILNAGYHGLNRSFVIHLSFSVGHPVLKNAFKVISVCETHTAQVLQPAVHKCSRVFGIFFNSSLILKQVFGSIFVLAIAVSLVVDELTFVCASIKELHDASLADALIVIPSAFVEFSVWIPLSALAVSPVMQILSFIITAILKHDFDPSVLDHTLFKLGFNNFILARIKNSISMRHIVLKIAFV